MVASEASAASTEQRSLPGQIQSLVLATPPVHRTISPLPSEHMCMNLGMVPSQLCLVTGLLRKTRPSHPLQALCMPLALPPADLAVKLQPHE